MLKPDILMLIALAFVAGIFAGGAVRPLLHKMKSMKRSGFVKKGLLRDRSISHE
jgi:uncharacterized protein involved in exopolysaccharide biosynthesis